MRIPFVIAALVVGSGCATNAVERPPVQLVHTATPGVAFVIVHPRTRYPTPMGSSPADSMPGQLSSDAEYVLLCDARGTGGMMCSIPSEVAASRISQTQHAVTSAPALNANLAELSGRAELRPIQLVTPQPSAAPENNTSASARTQTKGSKP